jgi:ATP phosphoribosyltransferase-like protein
MLQSCLEAEGKVGLMMNVHRQNLDAVLKMLPALQTPTVSHLSDPDWVALNTIVDESLVRTIIPQLKQSGAKGIVLRQVHVHGRFETDDRRKEPMFLKLAKAENDSASFVPVADGEFGEGTTSHAADLASVTYSRTKAEDGTDRLTLRIESKPVKDPKKPDAPAQPQVIELTMKRAD